MAQNDDRIIYINAENLKKKIMSQDTGLITGITIGVLLVIVAIVLLVVVKEGKGSIVFLLGAFLTILVGILLIYIDSRNALKSINKRIKNIKTTMFNDMESVECPLYFTKIYNNELGIFECTNPHKITNIGETSPLSAVPAGVKNLQDDITTNDPDPRYPWPVYLAT
jgi:c-di-AMP phosphodiesterase-like protein